MLLLPFTCNLAIWLHITSNLISFLQKKCAPQFEYQLCKYGLLTMKVRSHYISPNLNFELQKGELPAEVRFRSAPIFSVIIRNVNWVYRKKFSGHGAQTNPERISKVSTQHCNRVPFHAESHSTIPDLSF